MFGIQHPRIRPHTVPGTRVTLGKFGVNIPSISHFTNGASSELGQGSIVQWTPHGVFQPHTRVHRSVLGSPGQVDRANSTWFTPPALFQIQGIPNGFSISGLTFPNPVTKGTPATRHMAMNTFPAFKPPLPSYPAPAGWAGRF